MSMTLYTTMMVLFFRAVLRGSGRKGTNLGGGNAPRITVFKPLAGQDDDLKENLESFAGLEYPSFEILFGVATQADPAYRIALRFIAAHPELDARVVVTDPNLAVNPKVAQLLCLEREATGEVYVISDSNVRVRPGYLRSLMSELDGTSPAPPERGRNLGARVGLVWSIFSGAGERSFGAALENLQLCASCAPGLLAMDAVTERPLTVGKSMAMRRADLQQIGGFAPVGEVLAEDHALGRRFLDAGFVVRTSCAPVENRNVRTPVKRSIERHTRWGKMRRALFPIAFVGEPLVTPLNTASLALLLAPTKLTAAMWVLACLLQTCTAMLAVRVLRGSWMSWRYVPLELVRSYIALFCWVRACVSRRIEWRGHIFLMRRGTVIEPLGGEGGRIAAEGGPSRARLAA
jgi:ceramide glucosyltransferase